MLRTLIDWLHISRRPYLECSY